MNLTTVKTTADLPFKGIELVKVDKGIVEVVIAGKLRIRKGDYNGLQVLVDAPHETAKRYRLTAKTEGFDPKVSYFEHRFEADGAAMNYANAETSIDEIEVQIDEAGNVVEAPAEAVPPAKQPEPEMGPF